MRPLPQRHEVGHDAGLLDGPERAGAPDAGGHLVGDEVGAVLVGELAHAAQERRVVGEHPRRRLHERLDDDRAHAVALAGEQLARLGEHLGGAVGGRLPGGADARAAHHEGVEQDRTVGVVEQVDAADAHGAEGVAVVALGDVQVERAVLAALRLGLERHLDRGLDRARAVAGVEHAAEPALLRDRSRREQLLGELDAGLVGEAEEGRVVEPAELAADGLVDLRHAVPVHRDPQAGDAVEVARRRPSRRGACPRRARSPAARRRPTSRAA